MRTGSPISRTKISPASPMTPAINTRWTASGIVMKYRVASGWVMVTGPPEAICFRKIGMTDPSQPRTLPKRTARTGSVRLAGS